MKIRAKDMCIFVIAGVYTLLCSADPIDWCTLDCVKEGKLEKNTMCAYKSQKIIHTCENIRDSNTDLKRNMILHLHNQFRNEMAGGNKNGWPPAGNMQVLTWDYRLEDVALRWAEQCTPQHDECRRTPGFMAVGQNYGMLNNTRFNPESSTETFSYWVDEISSANSSIVDSYQDGNWSHFTQIAWAETYKVGCTQVQFTEKTNGTLWFRTVTICNYGPNGNILSKPMYKKGDPCLQCPEGWRCIPGSPYPYLCEVPEAGTVGGPAAGPEGPYPGRYEDGRQIGPGLRLNNRSTCKAELMTSFSAIIMVITVFLAN